MVVRVSVEVVDSRLRVLLAKKVDEGEPASEAGDLWCRAFRKVDSRNVTWVSGGRIDTI